MGKTGTTSKKQKRETPKKKENTIGHTLYLLFPTFMRSGPHHRHVFQKSVKITLYVILFGFLSINILSSQIMPSLYFGLVNDEQSSIISYLRIIRHTSLFSHETAKFDAIYNKPLSAMIFYEEKGRNETIQKLEQLLTLNPYSRDILYVLYLLYSQKGDTLMSRKYLRRAKEVDPGLKVISY